MHRTAKLAEQVKEFIELELPELCVSMDAYSSMNIVTTPTRISFTSKLRGKEEQIASCTIVDNELNGVILSGDTSKVISLMLYALDRAIQTN